MYRVLRHPSYTGYFWFSLGLMIMCGNVVCVGVYAITLWQFFRERIQEEEEALEEMYGEYKNYKKGTYILIPFI